MRARTLAALALVTACSEEPERKREPILRFADGGLDAAHAGSDAAVGTSQLSGCIAKDQLPRSCDEVCLDQGRRCVDDCDFGTALPGRAGYYDSLASCETGKGIIFSETTTCDASFQEQGFFPYGAVRCCCGASDFEVASAAQKAPLCETACDNDPFPPVEECSRYGSNCAETCQSATRGFDLACAACLIDAVRYSPSYCSSWECVCGGANFPDLWNTCDSACAATRDHERALYEALPRPTPVGRAPSARVETPAIHDVFDLTVDEAGNVWAFGRTLRQDRQTLAVSLLDADLNVRWSWEDPAARTVLAVGKMVRLAGQTVVSANLGDESAPLLFFDEHGFVRERAGSLPVAQHMVAQSDSLLMQYVPTGASRGALARVDADTAILYRAPDALFTDLSPDSWTFATHPNGALSLVSTVGSSLLWRRVQPDGVGIVWTHRLDAPRPEDTPLALGVAGDDDLLAWGTRRGQRANTSGGFPWLAQLGSDGSVRWQWANAELVTLGRIQDAVLTDSGVCTVGEESWEYETSERPSSGPVCSPDGCEALTVRCFDRAGSVRWKYHHRSDHSTGYSVVSGAHGELYVAGSIVRDTRRSNGNGALLLKFDP